MRALQLTGSTTLLPRMQLAAETYMNTHATPIVINGGCGTARGYKALLDGTADIAMASGSVPDELAAAAAERGLVFRDTVVVRDAILAVVPASNPLVTLTVLQLRNIFTGRVVNWREVGGPDAPIAVLVGPPTGGVTSSWRKALLGDDDTFTPLAQVLGTEERVVQLAALPRAITYVPQMAIAGDGLKVLHVDGIAAHPAAPGYPLWAPMMLVTLGAPAPEAARFIASAMSGDSA